MKLRSKHRAPATSAANRPNFLFCSGMLLVSKEAVPDHIRRGIRLGIAILILSSIGFSIVGREGCENWVPVFKWGLLTCPVVTMPLLGKVILTAKCPGQ